MALFNNNQDNSQKTPLKTTRKVPTFISKEMEVTGNFNGTGAIQVEGILHGNITVNSVVISESGVVNGIIKADNVIINGKLKGSIECKSLEIMKNGSVSNSIKVKNLKVTGELEGIVIASNLLNIASTGSVNAEITLNKLIIDEGGKIIGSIEQYKEEEREDVKKSIPLPQTHEEKEVKKPQPKERED
jgi:cytoskeletal protein CcmA (bactofilin family)